MVVWRYGEALDSAENTEKGTIRIAARLDMEYERKGNKGDPQVSKYE